MLAKVHAGGYFVQVSKFFPELKDYDDHWPVHRCVYLWRERNRKKALTLRSKAVVEQTEQARRVYVGKPLPRRMKFHSSRRTCTYYESENVLANSNFNTLPSPSESSTVVSKSTVLKQADIRGTTMTGLPLEVHTSISEPLGGGQRQRSSNIDVSSAIKASPVACLFCDHLPRVAPAEMANIDALFGGQPKVIELFTRIGIHNDNHLEILMKWGAKDFLESIQPPVFGGPLLKIYFYSEMKPLLVPQASQELDSRKVWNAASLRLLKRKHETPWSGCLTHPPVPWTTAPTRLQVLLDALEMEELMPLFLKAEANTNENLNLFSKISENDRMSVFEELDLPHLRIFQRWMLKIVLRNLDMLD
ncbi:hypothetical protein H0H81_000916 [Sphagnurus paluster]|uniref:Uncharacterized protein n=1 Tax=Sphagnurus paluster TaxID=117069 RepID=A0A9P7FW47_9AGAR|nr:hypothetical protein H0H81_000916 [Sphagnurus paluster]